jgi:hypothetical protein
MAAIEPSKQIFHVRAIQVRAIQARAIGRIRRRRLRRRCGVGILRHSVGKVEACTQNQGSAGD